MEENRYSAEFDRLIDRDQKAITEFGRTLFACPEPGFQEVKTNEILTSFFREEGIEVISPVCRTGLIASIGAKGGYHIALVADMDALYVTEGEKVFPRHACGHSIQTAVLAWCLKLLKESGVAEKTGGRISFIAAPAEEFLDFEFREKLRQAGEIRYDSGKQNMIEQGIFDNVDCVISMHVNGDPGRTFDIGSTLAGFMAKRVVFHGQASHSGAASHLGRNALHGASLCMDAIAYLKDQFPASAGLQIHPLITSVSGSVNIIPDKAVLESYVRANTLEELLEAGRRFDLCAVHSAEALGLTCTIENKTGYMPLRQSEKLNETIIRSMRKICRDEDIVRGVVSGAAGDIGDLAYLVPAVQFGFSGAGGRIHNSEFTIADEEHVYLHTAKVVLESVAELLLKPACRPDGYGYEERKAFYLKEWLHSERG